MSQKTAILIPIHPPYIEDIIEGTKEIEYRTTKPKLNPPFKMYLYASKTNDKTNLQKGTVVAECMCREIKKNWGRYDWYLSEVKKYRKPRELNRFQGVDGSEVKSAPQSWRYVKEQKR